MKNTHTLESPIRRSAGVLGIAAAMLFSGIIATPSLADEGDSVVGTSYSDTDAYMTVTPGTDLNPSDTTSLTVKGSNYDHTKPIYLGLGAHTSSDLEIWRRSQGGWSGPDGDYDYGSPQLIAAYDSSQDDSLADGQIDADGNWSVTVAIPGSTVPSFFGGEIDCLTADVGCGFFSFGAHGTNVAANEAYVGIEFADPNQVDPTPEPSETPEPTPDPSPEPTETETTAPEDQIASATGLGYNYDPAKQDQPQLTVEYPVGGLAIDGESRATLRGENYATSSDSGTTFGGAYTMFGVIELREDNDPGSWAPTKRGASGSNYDYAGEAGKYQLMVNYPGNTTEPGSPTMDENGNWVLEDHPIPGPQFTSQGGVEIDCLAEGVQCGFMTIGAHGQRSSGVEVFTPVEFAVQQDDEEPAEPAEETTTIVSENVANIVFAGEPTELTATVEPATATGTVEFFTGSTSLGTAEVVDGVATLETSALTGGAHQMKAIYTAEDATAFEASESGEQTYRIVDLAPAVDAIEIGDEARQIKDAQLNWTIANFVSFGSGPGKEAVEGNVELAELADDASAEDHANREFVFTEGTGSEDDAGNSVIEFTGKARLTSGTLAEWNFTDPHVYTSATGEGYITAVIDGHFDATLFGGEIETYGPERVVVQTFTGAESTTEDAITGFTATPLFEGQVAAGTWSSDYTGATLTNQFLQHVSSMVRSYFYQSGASADPSKSALPLSVSYESGVAPQVTVSENQSVLEGEDVVITATVEGEPAPTLQWQKNVDGAWQDLADATNSELSIAAATLADAGEYRVVVTNGYGSVESNTVSVEIVALEAAVIVTGPTDQTVEEGQNATFTVEATGVPAPTFQWQTQREGEWVDIDGATNASYVVEHAAIELDSTEYRVVVSNGVGDAANSDAATLTVTEAPEETPGNEGGQTPGDEDDQPSGNDDDDNQNNDELTTGDDNNATETGDKSEEGTGGAAELTNGKGGSLSETGATATMIAGGLGLALLIAGGALLLRRRGISAE